MGNQDGNSGPVYGDEWEAEMEARELAEETTESDMRLIERAVIASVLIDPRCGPRVREFCNRNDFEDQRLRLIYMAALAVMNQGEETSPFTVAEQLRASGRLEEAGGDAFLVELCCEIPRPPDFLIEGEE